MIKDVFDRIDLLSSINRIINKITFSSDVFMFQKSFFCGLPFLVYFFICVLRSCFRL